MLKYDPESLKVTIAGVTDLEKQKNLMESDEHLKIIIAFGPVENNEFTLFYTPLDDLIQLSNQEFVVNRRIGDHNKLYHYHRDRVIESYTGIQEYTTLQGKVWGLKQVTSYEFFDISINFADYVVYNCIAKKEYKSGPKLSIFPSKTMHDGNECYIVKHDVYGKPVYIWFDLSRNTPLWVYSEMLKNSFEITPKNFNQVMNYIAEKTQGLDPNKPDFEDRLPFDMAHEDRKLNRILNPPEG